MRAYKYISLSMLALISFFGAGCSKEEDKISPSRCELEFSVAISDSSIKQPTRASWEQNITPENGIEAESSISNLQLFIETSEGLISPLETIAIDRKGKNHYFRTSIALNSPYVRKDQSGIYRLYGRLIAVANYPSGINSPLIQLKFDSDFLHAHGLIPMWGVSSIEGLPLKEGSTADGGKIALLRTLPKISFQLADEIANDYVISDIEPIDVQFLAQGDVVPSGAEYVKTTEALDMDKCYNPVLDAPLAGKLDFIGIESNYVSAYPFEGPAINSEGMPVKFQVTLAHRKDPNQSIVGEAMMCDYYSGNPDLGAPFEHFIRNHDYRFVINLRELLFDIRVEKWVFGGKVHIPLN